MVTSGLKIPYWALLLLITGLIGNGCYIYARLNIAVDGVGSKSNNGKCVVTAIRPGSPSEKAGLKTGDILNRINNSPVSGNSHLWMLEAFSPGNTIPYEIVRNNVPHTLQITLTSFWAQHPWFYLILYSIILVVTVTSVYILLRKPLNSSVRVFFLFLQLFSIAQNTRFLFIDKPYATIATIVFIFGFNLFGAALLHFYLIFPEPVKLYRRFRKTIPIIYGIGFGISVVLSILLIRRNYFGIENANTFFVFSRWSIGWMGITLAFALITAIYRFKTTIELRLKKQVRLVLVGSVIGLITPILFSIYPEMIWRIEREYHLLTILEFPNAAGSLILITFLAVAIFRYRIWDIEIFIKRVVLYLGATLIILFFYFLLLFIVDIFAIQLVHPVNFLILVISVIIFLVFRDLIQQNIDRLFHREPYDSAYVVETFEEKLAGVYQSDELKEKIVRSLDDIFHFKTLLFALKKKNLTYKCVAQVGLEPGITSEEIVISGEFDSLLRTTRVFSIEEIFTDHQPMINLTGGELIIPLPENNQIFGFLIAGQKRSERSYTLQDIRVLSLLSRRIVALFHTAKLFKKDLDRQLFLERERSRIAEDLHDEVGASLTRITMLSEMTNHHVEDPVKIKPWLTQISETSRKVIEEMNQIIWALNPKNDNLEGLMAYVRRFTVEYLESTTMKYNFNFPVQLPAYELSVEERRNIYLVIREALHNVVKHSGANHLSLELTMKEKGFIIKIKDDGCGFDTENLSLASNGVANMKKRMTNIGGSLMIHSKFQSGTELFIDLSR